MTEPRKKYSSYRLTGHIEFVQCEKRAANFWMIRTSVIFTWSIEVRCRIRPSKFYLLHVLVPVIIPSLVTCTRCAGNLNIENLFVVARYHESYTCSSSEGYRPDLFCFSWESSREVNPAVVAPPKPVLLRTIIGNFDY